MKGNINVFHKLILSFLTGVASMLKITKITSLQYVTNDMLDYLDFSYVHRPPKTKSNPLSKGQSKTIANVDFCLTKQDRDQGLIMLFALKFSNLILLLRL